MVKMKARNVIGRKIKERKGEGLGNLIKVQDMCKIYHQERMKSVHWII